MSDTPQRPARPDFEPPPWEREQFEELARRREERARAEAEAERARAEAAPVAPAEVPAEGDEPAATPTPTAAEADGEASDGSTASAIDEKRVEAMLAELSAEQPSSLRGMKRASKVAAGVIGAIGVSITTIAVMIGSRAQDGGAMGISAAALGLSVVGLAAWLWSRTR